MGNDRFWRFFKSLVCFLLICCILINCSPIKAKAVAIEASIALGLIAILLAGSAGVVFTAQTDEQIVDIGESMKTYLYQWGTSAEKLDEVDDFILSLQVYDWNDEDGDGEPDNPNEQKVRLAQGLLAGISAWCASLILGMNEIKDSSTATDGRAFYNGYYLPTIITYSNYLNYYIISYPDGSIYEYATQEEDDDFYASRDSDTGETFFGPGTFCYIWPLEENSWGTRTRKSVSYNSFSADQGYDILWSNRDVLWPLTGEVYFYGSEPQTLEEFVISPYFVGDIPQQVQDGEIEEEEIPLPTLMDYSQLFQNTGATTAQEAVTQTMQQLSTGQMTHADYMDAIQSDTAGDDGSGNSPSTPVPDMLPYALDLKDFFPFCIPFDIYDFFSALIATPEAPKFHWEFQDLSGRTYVIDIDLSPWNTLAATFRSMQLLLFIVGLAVASRKFIKW